MYLEQINEPSDLRKFNDEQLSSLSQEIRNALIKKLSIHGGHFGPNLGMVALCF